jgi:predicted thioesterase
MSDTLASGLSTTVRYTVDTARTIDFMGEELRVYSTPSMLQDMERTCRDMLVTRLESGQDTVGIAVELQHLGATLLGMWVDVTARVTNVDDRRIDLEIETVDESGQTVGKANHARFVVDVERQKARLRKLAAKVRGGE